MLKFLKKNEKGFSVFESLLSLLIVSTALLSLFMIMNEINRVDKLSKENHFAENLISPYISYYQELRVKHEDVGIYLSDVKYVNLVDEARKKNPSSVPLSFRDLDVECVNDPILTKDNKFVKFKITCEIDGQLVNKGRPFIIKKFIE